MNMMKVQSEREELSVPAMTHEDDDFALDAPSSARVATSNRSKGLAKGLSWFEDQRLASKVNTIFAGFAVFGTAMLLVLGFGMSEVWNRYHTSDAVERTMNETSEFRATFGAVRYNSALTLNDPDLEVSDRRRIARAEVLAQLDSMESALRERAPQFAPRVAALRSNFEG